MKLHFGIALDASYGNLDKEDHCCTEFFVSIYRNVFPDYRGGLFLNMRHHSIIHFLLLCMLSSCLSDSPGGIDSMQKDRSMVDRSPEQYIRISDSLLKKYDGKRDVSERISILLSRQRAFSLLGLMDSVLSTGVLIRAEAEAIADSLSMARSLLPIRGNLSPEQQQQFEPYLEGALRTLRNRGMDYEQGVILALMGYVETSKARVESAVKYLQEAREKLEPLDSIRALYPVILNLGNNLSALGHLTEAGSYFRQAFALSGRMKDSLRMSISLQSLAILSKAKNEIDSTIYFLLASENFLPLNGGGFISLQIRYNLAEAFRLANDFDQAEKTYAGVLEEFQAMGSPEGIAMAQRGLAILYGNTGRLPQAIGLMEGSIRYLDSIGFRIQLVEQYEELIELYKKTGQNEAALVAFKDMKQVSDSLFSLKQSIAVKDMEFRYQSEKKEDENKNLRRQVKSRNIISTALVAMLLLFGMLVVVLRQRNRYHQELSRTYAVLMEKYVRERDQAMERLTALSHSPTVPAVTPVRQHKPEPAGPDLSEATGDSVLYEKALVLFRDEKIHLKAALKAEDVAERLGISARKLSALLKQSVNMSFSQFLNMYRVSEASRLLEDPSTRQYKLDFIASRSGFGNRQHFRRVFEQVTGVNPGFYRDHIGQVPDEVDQEIV